MVIVQRRPHQVARVVGIWDARSETYEAARHTGSMVILLVLLLHAFPIIGLLLGGGVVPAVAVGGDITPQVCLSHMGPLHLLICHTPGMPVAHEPSQSADM